MLHKDQYNEDAYNDVYTQAAAGAEIKYSQGNGGKNKLLLIFILLALISTLGYFVWKNLSSINKDNSQSISTKEKITTSKSEEESLEIALQNTLLSAEKEESSSKDTSGNSSTTDIVTNVVSQTANGKMSPTDIARIVQLVTQQMQDAKKVEIKVEEISKSKKVKDSLEASLENMEIDTLSSEELIVDSINGSQKKEATNNSKTNIYNKIIVKKSDTNDNLTDELSQLSMEISNVINSNTTDDVNSKSTKYTSSLSKEADTRTKEMRYHIVKKGDTLAGIAYKIYGSSKDYIKLYEANPDILRRADQIYIGQRLRVPE